MAKKNGGKGKGQFRDIPFYEYLLLFYRDSRSKVRQHYTQLTKKYLDFNHYREGSGFLRRPQYEALEMYVFLKEFCQNQPLQQIFRDWADRKGVFEGRQKFTLSTAAGGTLGIFEEADAEAFEVAFKRLNENPTEYSNYIFALTMGLGKTILMGTCIFYEFLLANKYPKDLRFAHNAIVFAPDKTVLQSLREIQTFDKSKVVPPEYLNWLDTHLQFHFLDDSGVSLNIIDKSSFNLIISNTQKIILKKQHKQRSKAQLFIEGTESLYKAKSLNADYADLYGFDDEVQLLENQRFAKLTRLRQLAVYVDEAHHAFGSKLKNNLKSFRLTINELAANLREAGTSVVGCYNFTGTPYIENRLLPEVVYAYGLKDAINNRYLKKVELHGFTNVRDEDLFVKKAVQDFWAKHEGKTYENLRPKIAFFASSIEELETKLKPAVERQLTALGIPHSSILVNVGDPRLTTNDDIREFNNLDKPSSEKQFILLVNKGTEGWNCRSLFAVGLYREPKSKIFVLQATMRCLRSITDVQQSGDVYLSAENLKTLDEELQANLNMSVEDLRSAGSANPSTVYQVRVTEPVFKLKLSKKRDVFDLQKNTNIDSVDFEWDQVDTDRYHSSVTRSSITRIDYITGREDITDLKEKQEYSEMTLVAEIARYLNLPALEVESILEASTPNLTELVAHVNEFNELLHDWIIPHLFGKLYTLKKYTHEEEQEIDLIRHPAPPRTYYEMRGREELVALLNSPEYANKAASSFHVDTYIFDSGPELQQFKILLKDNDIDKVFFTGMFTAGQSEFRFHYIDPESHTVRCYYPDFLVVHKNGRIGIIEVKGEKWLEDPTTKAKTRYASSAIAGQDAYYKLIAGKAVGNA
jgi:type III restriction enzyme